MSTKDKAKELLRIKIASFKQEELISNFIDETVDDMWNIFEDGLVEEIQNGKKSTCISK